MQRVTSLALCFSNSLVRESLWSRPVPGLTRAFGSPCSRKFLNSPPFSSGVRWGEIAFFAGFPKLKKIFSPNFWNSQQKNFLTNGAHLPFTQATASFKDVLSLFSWASHVIPGAAGDKCDNARPGPVGIISFTLCVCLHALFLFSIALSV